MFFLKVRSERAQVEVYVEFETEFELGVFSSNFVRALDAIKDNCQLRESARRAAEAVIDFDLDELCELPREEAELWTGSAEKLAQHLRDQCVASRREHEVEAA